MNEIANLLTILYVTGIHQHLNTTLSLSVLVSLYLCVASIIVIELGRIMKSPGGILMLISDFMSQTHSEPNTNQTDKHPTPKN